jgi:hypothetical protein
MGLYPELCPPSAVTDLVSTLALWIAVAFLSDAPHLYATSGGHIFDTICLDLTANKYGAYDVKTPAFLSALADLADGAFIGASIGSRTSVSGRYVRS